MSHIGFLENKMAHDSNLKGTLPRRCYLGVVLDESPRHVVTNGNEDIGQGVSICHVHRGSAAATAGLQPGDIVLVLGGVATPSVSEFLRSMRMSEPGVDLDLVLLRRGKLAIVNLRPEPMPLESSIGVRTCYTSVQSNGVRLRVIATIPKGLPPWPTVLLLQGLRCESVDCPFDFRNLYRMIATTLARNGLVAIRLERRGTGDSEGAPTRDLDFQTELEDYTVFARQACRWEFVNPEMICIFGYSMGGVLAPLVARRCPSQALATFGSIGMPWNRYVIETAHRQRLLTGTDKRVVEKDLERLGRALDLLNSKLMTPREIRRRCPELSDLVGDYMHSRHYTYFTELAELDIPSQWCDTNIPTLVLAGNADYVASLGNQLAIFRSLPHGSDMLGSKLLRAPVDHWFRHVNTITDSLNNKTKAIFYHKILSDFASWFKKLRRV